MAVSRSASVVAKAGRVRRILFHPLLRMLIEFAIFFGSLFVLKITLIKPGLGLLGLDETMFRVLQGSLTIAAMFSIYIVLIRIYEKRKVRELSLLHLGRDSLTGMLLGTGLVSSVFAILWLAGAWYIVAAGSIGTMIVAVIWVFLMAALEEFIFRGIVYRIVEEWLGTVSALVLSAGIFGGMHIFNENSNMLAVLSATTGGLLAGALYSLTGRLWIPIFFHFSWNLTQAVFGSVVSGMDIFGVYFESVLDGPDWLTGGAFGIENSVVTFVLMFALLAILLMRIKQRNLLLTGSRRARKRLQIKAPETRPDQFE